MTMTTTADRSETVIDEDEANRLRAGTWAMLGRLLMSEPSADTLQRLGEIAIDADTAQADRLTRAWAALRQAAREVEPDALQVEFQNVFIGVGGGEVTPYASWYLSGTLMDRPLIQLRDDLAQLGMEVDDGCSEPEDHAAAVCEIMALIIQDPDVDADWQRDLFRRHVASWMARFFDDVEKAPSAAFYRSVAALGRAFLDEEQRLYEMPA